MTLEGSFDTIHALSHAITIINFVFMMCVIVFTYKIYKKVQEMFGTNENNLVDVSNEILRRIEYINRWQKLLAKMIRDDRHALREHDERVNEIRSIIEEISLGSSGHQKHSHGHNVTDKDNNT